MRYKPAQLYPYLLISLPRKIGRISSSVLLRSSSVWQLARISSRFSVEIMKASLQPVQNTTIDIYIPILQRSTHGFDFLLDTLFDRRQNDPCSITFKGVAASHLLHEIALFVYSRNVLIYRSNVFLSTLQIFAICLLETLFFNNSWISTSFPKSLYFS